RLPCANEIGGLAAPDISTNHGFDYIRVTRRRMPTTPRPRANRASASLLQVAMVGSSTAGGAGPPPPASQTVQIPPNGGVGNRPQSAIPPVSPAAESDTVSVQVPAGFSPMNAESGWDGST